MTIINEHRIPDSILTAEQIEAAKTPEDRAREAEMVAAAAAREDDRAAIVAQALVWLDADATRADTRAAQIAKAIEDVDSQIAAVQAYTFAGTNIATVNASLNNALKPQLSAILAKQRGIGVVLQELMEARARHGDALVWIGRYLTR